MMRRLPFFIFVFILTAANIWAGPVLTTNIDTIDLGIVPQYTDFCQDIILRSTGDKPVKISDVNTFCSCIEFPLEKTVLPPGDSTVVRLKFNTSSFVGQKEWRPHIYNDGESRIVRIRIVAFIVADVKMYKPIHAFPFIINASQFGEADTREFPFQIINKSDEYVPLKLVYSNEKYYKIDFPGFIPPNDTAFGRVVIDENYIDKEFDSYLTFEFIDSKSEKHLYSIPVKRKLYKPKE
ncbi:MAG: DUF1573 domain-containing protein [Candidatus Zixiibacteriota bacterium]